MFEEQDKSTDETARDAALEAVAAEAASTETASTQESVAVGVEVAETSELSGSEDAEAPESPGPESSEEVAPVEDAAVEDEDNGDEEEDAGDEVDDDAEVTPIMEIDPDAEEPADMEWYILKVQSNRERSISEALQRKIAIEGLDRFFGQVIVPTEKVTEFKAGKKKVVERKLWPGYIVVNMHINDDTWFAVRETGGIGDFTGAAGKPSPMLPHEVARIIQTEKEDTEEAPKLAIGFKVGDKVKVKDGNFESFEGDVSNIDEASGRVTVMINIFGRSTPVELEYWQIEAV